MSHYFKGQRKHELTHAYEHRFYGKKTEPFEMEFGQIVKLVETRFI